MGGENVSSANQLYPQKVSITVNNLSRNKDNIINHLEKYTPPQFKYKIFFEKLHETNHTKNLMKYTILFDSQNGLNWFKNYLSVQGISPNSPDT